MDKYKKVYSALSKIPKGKVTTYKAVADKCGLHSRDAARIISKNPFAPSVPCHRVVRSSRELGGYTYKGEQNPEKKKLLLKKEGIKFFKDKVNEEFMFFFR